MLCCVFEEVCLNIKIVCDIVYMNIVYDVAGLPTMLYVALLAYWSAQNVGERKKNDCHKAILWSTAMTA